MKWLGEMTGREWNAPIRVPVFICGISLSMDSSADQKFNLHSRDDPTHVGTQTPGLGPYTTNRDIPTLGAGGETAGIWA
jgi:hypothetical protein